MRRRLAPMATRVEISPPVDGFSQQQGSHVPASDEEKGPGSAQNSQEIGARQPTPPGVG